MPHHKPDTKAKKPKSHPGRHQPSEPRENSSRAIGSSSKAHGSSRQSTEATTQRMTRGSDSEEKKAYDNFFTYLPMNAWLYDPRRDPVPSFPRTDEEIARLVREPTQSDLDSLAQDIAAGRVRVKLKKTK